MGTWGEGVFDSDTALDEFAAIFPDLVCRLRYSIDREHIGDHDFLEGARVIAHIVGLVAAGCSPHDYYTRADAIEWRRMAEGSLRHNMGRSSAWTGEEIEKAVLNLRATFDAVIEHAAPEDSISEDGDYYFNYEVWLRTQKEIEKIDTTRIRSEVLEAYESRAEQE